MCSTFIDLHKTAARWESIFFLFVHTIAPLYPAMLVHEWKDSSLITCSGVDDMQNRNRMQ